ncbi:MAG: hypothetical protein ACI8X5_000454 [Planctomycetota bacterium]|jgi:hypothetical protein
MFLDLGIKRVVLLSNQRLQADHAFRIAAFRLLYGNPGRLIEMKVRGVVEEAHGGEPHALRRFLCTLPTATAPGRSDISYGRLLLQDCRPLRDICGDLLLLRDWRTLLSWAMMSA